MAIVRAATPGGLYVLGREEGVELPGRDVTQVAADESGWYGIVDAKSLWFRPSDADWTERATIADRRLNCVLPTPHGILLGTDHAHLLRVDDGITGAVDAFETAPGRDDWYTPWGGPPDVRSLARTEDALYVNVHVGGILRSADGGATWTPTIDIHSDVHQVVAGGGVLFAATAVGLALSHDEGESWEFDEEGLDHSYARAVAVSGDQVLMSASAGPRGGHAAIYRRRVGGPGFEKVHAGLPEWFPHNIDSGCLGADGEVVAFTTADGSVYLSEDSGSTWEQLTSGLPGGRALLVDA